MPVMENQREKKTIEGELGVLECLIRVECMGLKEFSKELPKSV